MEGCPLDQRVGGAVVGLSLDEVSISLWIEIVLI